MPTPSSQLPPATAARVAIEIDIGRAVRDVAARVSADIGKLDEENRQLRAENQRLREQLDAALSNVERWKHNAADLAIRARDARAELPALRAPHTVRPAA